MIRNRIFYRPLAKLFNRISDILFNYIENNSFKLEKWNEILDTIILSRISNICNAIHSKFANELETLSFSEYQGQAYIRQLTDRIEKQHQGFD